MTDTTFVENVTVIEAAWLNEVNNLVHTVFGNPVDAAAARTAISVPSVSEQTTAIAAHAALTTSHGVLGAIVGTSDSQTLTNKTLVAASNTITTAAAGNLVATELNAALAELDGQDTTLQTNINTVQSNLDTHIADPTSAHAASAIGNTPAGNIAATDVQSAINELDTEKVAQTTTLTAGVGISGGGDLSANRTFDLDINGLTSETVVDTTADYIAMYDASATAIRKVLVGSLPTSLPLFQIQHQETSGTAGGSTTSGSWNTHKLNTVVVNEITGASLSTNQVTLPAGTYFVEGYSMAYKSNAFRSKLYNVTDAADEILGCSAYTSSGQGVVVESYFSGYVTLAASKILELQDQVTASQATNGYGLAATFGVNEIYAELKIRKLQ